MRDSGCAQHGCGLYDKNQGLFIGRKSREDLKKNKKIRTRCPFTGCTKQRLGWQTCSAWIGTGVDKGGWGGGVAHTRSLGNHGGNGRWTSESCARAGNPLTLRSSWDFSNMIKGGVSVYRNLLIQKEKKKKAAPTTTYKYVLPVCNNFLCVKPRKLII